MKCKRCNKKMDKESEDFCEETDLDWCLDCCGKQYEESAKKGIKYHASISVRAE